MATWSTAVYASKQPAVAPVSAALETGRLHAITGTLTTGLATNDVINFGYIPRGAVVVGANLKAASQLDSNGSPTLTFDLGIPGTAQLFKAAVSTVGRAAGASNDTTITATGSLYKNTTGADLLIIGTVHAQAATAVAGTLELELSYFLEPTAGSNP